MSCVTSKIREDVEHEENKKLESYAIKQDNRRDCFQNVNSKAMTYRNFDRQTTA